MKRLFYLFVALSMLCAWTGAAAQEYVPTPVTVSKEKVKLNGKVYLSHVVLERQTIFGITRAYGVTEDELYEANPSLRETGLQKNAIILIPYREQAAEGTTAVQDDKSYSEHVVKWYEDLDDISKRYNVSAKELMEFNGLKSRKLTSRQVLRIPLKPATTAAQNAEPAPVLAAAAAAVPAPEPEPEPLPEPVAEVAHDTTAVLRLKPRDRVECSLVLPMKAAGQQSELNMDFYSGVLMAVKDLEQDGLKIKLNVYDLAAGLPNADALKRSDFVLGPVASRDLEAILQRVEGDVPVISPLDQKAASLALNYRNFIQAPTAADSQYDDLCEWVRQDFEEGDKILFISEKGAGNVTASVALRSALAQRELTYEILSYAIVEGRGIPAILSGLMVGGGTNRVVVASESEAFVGDVVRNLGIMMGKGFNIVMYAPSKVRTFDTIEGSDYHGASLHISTSYFADYESGPVDRFVRAYRSLFQTEPSQFAFQGYDTARYFISRVARYGDDWKDTLNRERARGLHTDFLFQYDRQDNAANQAVRRIIFRKDYTTTLE